MKVFVDYRKCELRDPSLGNFHTEREKKVKQDRGENERKESISYQHFFFITLEKITSFICVSEISNVGGLFVSRQ